VVIGAAGGLLTRNATSWHTLVVYAVGALVIAVGVRLLAGHPHVLERPTRAVLGGVNRLRRRPPGHGQEKLFGFVEQLRSIRVRPASFAVAVTLALLNWLLDALCLWMCCVAVGVDDVNPTKLVIAYCAGMAAASVPIIPGGLGVVDAALILGLVAGGLTSSSAVAAVVLYRLVSFGFIIGAGWLFWLAIRARHSSRPTAPKPQPQP